VRIAPAIDLAASIAAREVSAVEVVQAHLDRISSEVNAFTFVDAEGALAAARDPLPGPLSGVPFTVKDTVAVAGWPLVMGDPERAGERAVFDATVVTRLRAAGAILLGKTNCPPYGGGIETDNAVTGRTSNPYDLARTPGGSSGGEAAAIASGASAFGIGTDSGASVRLPAHFCGVAALKPTAGRVPLTGVVDDLGPLGSLSDPRTQVGPLARSVADLALVLSIVAGPDGRDGGVPPVPSRPPGLVRGLRVAVLHDDGLAPPDADTRRVVALAAEALGEAEALVEEAAPPGGGHALTIEVWGSYGAEAIGYDLLRRWDAYREAMLGFGEGFDLILSPVFSSAAPRHGEIENLTSYTTSHSLTGWPAATVRCGTSAEGLPIGVQLAAHPWRDDVALAAALALESALGGYSEP
jgi:amidase